MFERQDFDKLLEALTIPEDALHITYSFFSDSGLYDPEAHTIHVSGTHDTPTMMLILVHEAVHYLNMGNNSDLDILVLIKRLYSGEINATEYAELTLTLEQKTDMETDRILREFFGDKWELPLNSAYIDKAESIRQQLIEYYTAITLDELKAFAGKIIVAHEGRQNDAA